MLKELDPEFQKSLKFAASDYRNGEACQYTEVPTGVANQKGLQTIRHCETNGHNSETGVSICHCQFLTIVVVLIELFDYIRRFSR